MKNLCSLFSVTLLLVLFATQAVAGGGDKTVNNRIDQDVQLGTVSEKRECPQGASCNENYILRGGVAIQVLAPIIVTPEVTEEKKTKSKK